MKNLILNSDDCAFLSHFHENTTVSGLSEALKMDKSQISRRMAKIAALAPVLIRIQGRWTLTPEGLKLVRWYREMIDTQEMIFSAKEELVIGTSQTMSERKLTSILSLLIRETQYKKIKIVSNLDQIENSLISGAVDFALVCSRPQSPEIRYKKIFKSSYVILLPQDWKDQFNSMDELFHEPYISHSALDVRSMLGIEKSIPPPVVAFDHLAGVRQAIGDGLGWSILPHYSCDLEIRDKKMKILKKHPHVPVFEEFQLCWINGKFDKKFVTKLVDLLIEKLAD